MKLFILESGSLLLKRNSRLLQSILVLILASCAPVSAATRGADPTPTAVIAGETAIQPPAEPEPTPRPTIEPFRFVLPTPGAEPVLGWRPPLYPVPWAVSAYDHFYFTRPIAADNVNWPLAEYRYGGVFFAPDVVHTGVDIGAEEGTPILAAGPGIIVSAGWGLFSGAADNINDPYGKAVAIKHDFGYKGEPLYTIYAHMSETIALVGQHVETGDVIGLVGATGATTGPHLHFEVRMGGNTFYTTYNPELWMSPPQGWGVLVGRVTEEKGRLLNYYPLEVRPEPSGVPLRRALTYAQGAVNSDPYYNENLVLSDLPAGIYKLTINYKEKDIQTWVEIFPGQVTYFTFTDKEGFQVIPPPEPKLDFLPVTVTSTVTPTP
ncbi:MAG: peptidoglycan DD-metalloendopeptidase family protein [Anaerolineales bacterium]|nr:peptidoglycan DD-metalloendopeptidase family protein [Anaerolineales bacterium]